MATLDVTTQAEYAAETTASARAQVIVDALVDPVTVRVYSSSDDIVGEGTVAAPWASVVADRVVIGTLDDFLSLEAGTPDNGWYLQFESGTRSVRLSFGLAESGQEAEWSLSSWSVGVRAGIISGEITVVGERPPEFTVAPTSATVAGTGGTIQFTAVDPDGDTVVYSLTTTRAGITINSSTGVVTVTAAAAGTSGNIVVQASDGALTEAVTCAVTVLDEAPSDFVAGHWIRFYIEYAQASLTSAIASFASMPNIAGVTLHVKWKALEATKGDYTGSGSFSWAYMDAYAAAARAAQKYFAFNVIYRVYSGSSTPNPTVMVPQYLVDEGYTFVSLVPTTNKSAGVQVWKAVPTGYLIELYKRIIDRYRDNPYFFGFTSGEGTFGEGSTNPVYGWTTQGYVDQFIRKQEETIAYLPSCRWLNYTNWINRDPDPPIAFMQQIFTFARNNPRSIYISGGPDMLTPPGNEGTSDGMQLITGPLGWGDHRGRYAIHMSTENEDTATGSTIQQIYDKGVGTYRANILSWLWLSTPSSFKTDLTAFISSHPTVTTKPSDIP